MPKETVDLLLERELEKRGEKALWKGKPNPEFSIYFLEGNPLNASLSHVRDTGNFFPILLIIGIIIAYGAYNFGGFGVLVPTVFLELFLFFLPDIFIAERKRKTRYAVTESGILFLLWHWRKRKIEFIPYTQISRVTLSISDEGNGDISIWTNSPVGFKNYDFESSSVLTHPTLSKIDDAGIVGEIIKPKIPKQKSRASIKRSSRPKRKTFDQSRPLPVTTADMNALKEVAIWQGAPQTKLRLSDFEKGMTVFFLLALLLCLGTVLFYAKILGIVLFSMVLSALLLLSPEIRKAYRLLKTKYYIVEQGILFEHLQGSSKLHFIPFKSISRISTQRLGSGKGTISLFTSKSENPLPNFVLGTGAGLPTLCLLGNVGEILELIEDRLG